MVIGERLRALREQKKLSQGEIEKRTGLLRCYVSRVENGHTVPSIATLEKYARALEVPLYEFFYDGKESPKILKLPNDERGAQAAWGNSGKDADTMNHFRKLLGRTNDRNRKLLLFMAQKMAGLFAAHQRDSK